MQTTDVRETAQNAVNQGKSFLGKQVDERSTLIGQQIGSLAQDLRNVGDQLRESGTVGGAAGYVDQGAQLIERVGRYLEDADSDRLIADLETYARKQPWAVAAGALLVGFAASRFLKTSSVRRYHGADAQDSYAGSTARGAGRGTSYGTSSTYGETSYGDTTGTRSRGPQYAT